MWVRIENNQIAEGPMVLPQSWRNISGLPLLGNDGLREIGWLPYNDNRIDVPAGKVAVPAIAIGTTSVEVTYTLRDMTAEELAIANAPPPVPQTVTPLQARRAINAAGLRAAIEAAIAAADQDAKDAWEYATVIERSNPTIAAMATGLGLTEAQIDDLFRAAALVT